MTDTTPATPPDRAARDWTCPFCSLLCDGLTLAPAHDGASWSLGGSDCPRALAALQHASPAAIACSALVDGRPVSLDEAIAAAAERLSRWTLPLYGGLATDVAGARALYRLMNRTGGVADHANGDALATGLRAMQDRGAFYTTLAEIKAHADLIVCLGSRPDDHYPEFFRRCGVGEPGAFVESREVIGVAWPADTTASPAADATDATGGPPADDTVAPATADAPAAGGTQQIAARGVSFNAILPGADVHATAATLAALCAGRRLSRPADPALEALAGRMKAARYVALVWEPGSVARHGSLVAEAVLQCVAALNAKGRAAAFALGGSEGGYTVQQAFTWMSGLPLRTALRAGRFDHDPLRHAGKRLLADRAVDGLFWVSSFGPAPALPKPGGDAPAVIDTRMTEPPDDLAEPLPAIVLGHPAQGAALEGRAGVVFIPVGTPGIDGAGHLFRTEGSVLIPLVPARDGGLPGVAEIVARIAAALPARAGAAQAASADGATATTSNINPTGATA
ncbi:hypothetical protein [Derxia gummosa]|uniref:Formylmethanofuran dehydrogenase n=1 Tax=Derxia gummosa DSM 723 TaxID=1121388 RepID=A0A8B6X7N4_9BURK|nr:hypothetical protein [Derxia gummosa]